MRVWDVLVHQITPVPWVLLFTGVTYISVGLYLATALLRNPEDKSVELRRAAIVLTISCMLLSVYTVLTHLGHWRQPTLQTYAVRMVLMVPIYSVESLLAVTRTHPSSAIVWETLRESYEAFVIYCFVRFLITGLALEEESNRRSAVSDNAVDATTGMDQHQLVKDMMERKQATHVQHVGGVGLCLTPWRMGEEFLVKTKLGTMGYVWTRLVCTVATLVLLCLGWYHEGAIFDAKGGYMYIMLVLSISQTWALYVLLLFYYEMHVELQPLQPLLKFISIKSIIFLSFWQSMLLVFLSKVGAIPNDDSTELNARALQDLLICVEMPAAAAAMHSAFGADISQADGVSWGWWSALCKSARISVDVLSPADVISESEESAALLTADVQVQGEVQLELHYVATDNRIEQMVVRVIQARDIAAGDIGGVSDPYACVSLRRANGTMIEGAAAKYQTDAALKTLNPK